MKHVIAAALALSAAATLQAQAVPDSTVLSRTQKVFIIAGPNGSAIDIEGSNEIEGGNGITLGLGYGITRYLALFVAGAFDNLAVDQGTSAMGHFDLGVRFHFADPARRWIPFLDAALTGRGIVREDELFCGQTTCVTRDMSMAGAGYSFGGGVLYYAMPK